MFPNGSEAETKESIKFNAPKSYADQDRASNRK